MLVVVITTLTTLTTTTAAVYAGGGDDNNNGDENKQKAEDDSAAAIANCDHNDVERAGFDCIAIAANDVEIETEPPEEERATLSVCKSVFGGPEPDEYTFTVTGNNPSPAQFLGDPNCVDVDIGPGEYAVTEALPTAPVSGTFIQEGSDCEQDPNNRLRATGEIQAGETQECIFVNFLD